MQETIIQNVVPSEGLSVGLTEFKERVAVAIQTGECAVVHEFACAADARRIADEIHKAADLVDPKFQGKGIQL